MEPPASIIRGQNYISKSLKNASSQALKKYENYSLKNGGAQGRHFVEETPRGIIYIYIYTHKMYTAVLYINQLTCMP